MIYPRTKNVNSTIKREFEWKHKPIAYARVISKRCKILECIFILEIKLLCLAYCHMTILTILRWVKRLMLIKRIWPYYEIYPKLLLSCRNCLKIYSEFGYPFEKHDSHSSVILKNSQTETKCRCLSAAQLYLKENIYNCKVWHWNHPHKCKYLYSILICLLISLQHLSYTQTRHDMKKLLKILCVCT